MIKIAYKGCVHYIFACFFSFISQTRAPVILEKAFFISFPKLFLFSRKSNFRTFGFQIS